MLKRDELRDRDRNGDGGDQDGLGDREWVLPTHLREAWSLRRFAEVFDAISEVPPEPAGAGEVTEGYDGERRTRRGGNRVLLATVDTDSTIVYYIVHDGIVKPRQN